MAKKSLFYIFILFFLCKNIFANPKIIITEISPCETSNAEWLEVWNISDENIDFTEWKFWEQNTNHGIKSINQENVLHSGSGAIIVDKQENFLEIFPDFIGQIFDSSWGSLKNSGEEIGLKNNNGEIIENFIYPECESQKTL